MTTTENAIVEDGTGQQVLDELNELILAEVTKFSSVDEPADPQPYQNWINLNLSPPPWMVRNAENNAWIKIGEFLNAPTNQFRHFSDGAAVPSTSVANTFTETQTVDNEGSAGEVAIGSDLSAGVAALIRLFAHNASAADFTGFQAQMTVTDATEASEDVSVAIQTMAAGTLTTLMTLAAAAVTIAGTLNATTLQQGGTDLDGIIEDAIDSLDTSRSVSGAFTLAQTDAGKAIKFTGGSAQDVTCGRLTLDTVVVIHNVGTADLTLVSAAASNDVTFENGTTIAAGKTASLIMIETGASQADNVWRILGENT